MKTYIIPVTWSSVKTFTVEAENLQSAVKQALENFFEDPSQDDNYIEDSFGIDGIVEDNYPGEDYNIFTATD
jgi:hypothetical protein